jgi:SSS family solute:Na+ symporter
VICLAVMLFGVEGGPPVVFSTAAAAGKFSLGEFGAGLVQGRFWFDASSATILVVLLYGVFINLQNFGIDQSYVQRYIASSSDREARKSLWLGGILYVPVSAIFFLIGTTLYVYYHAEQHERELPAVKQLVARQRLMQQGIFPEYETAEEGVLTADYLRVLGEEAGELTDQDIGDRVFPHFIAKHLPPGVTGLLIAAVFAAAMSTVSTSLNSSATLLMSDYYRRFFNPGATERQCMLALYVSTVAWGILGTVMALMLVKLTDSALDIWWTLSGIFGGGMCGLFLLGMISRRARSPAAVTGVVTGVLIILWMSLPKLVDYLLSQPAGSQAGQWGVWLQRQTGAWLSPLHAFMVPVVGTLTILLVGLLASRIRSASHTAE